MPEKKKAPSDKKNAPEKKKGSYKERFLAAKAKKSGAYMTHKGGLILRDGSKDPVDKAAKVIDTMIKPKKKPAKKNE